jgi:hypothetical protein
MSIEAMKQARDELEHIKAWCLRSLGIGLVDENKLTSLSQAIAEAEKQEPEAWMDVYRNIYSLEEKAAGCPEATIPLVPLANQEKTSGSPKPLTEGKDDNGQRLYAAVSKLAALAGEDADDTVDWLCGDYGLSLIHI